MKPYFLKDLKYFASGKEMLSVEDVLLVDDSPVNNLLNNSHNAIHSQSWSGDMQDQFLFMVLVPWLYSLFESNKAITIYMKANLIPSGQCPMDPLSSDSYTILKDTIWD